MASQDTNDHVMDSTINTICGFCNLNTEEEELVICCEGFCGKWFHCSCVKISNDQCDMFSSLDDNAAWLCPIDKLEFNKWKLTNKNPNLKMADNRNLTFSMHEILNKSSMIC